jgi:hypothetical protein
MALNIVKYSAEQGSFSATKNNVDIHLPANSGVYDLSKSYININVTCNQTIAAHPDAVYTSSLAFTEGGGAGNIHNFVAPPTNAVIVKHCDFISQSKGSIERIRHVDALRSNLAIYQKDKSYLKEDKNAFRSAQTEQVFTKGGANEIYNVGSVGSRVRPMDLRVDLKDLFGFGVVEQYDTSKFGNTKIHLQCNFDKLGVSQSITDTHPWAVAVRTGEATYGNFADNAINVAGGDEFTIQTNAVYNTIEEIPFHTNQLLTVTFTDTADGADQTEDCRISSIEHLANGKVKITFANKIKTIAANDTMTDISVVQKAPTTSTVTINKVELVAYRTEDQSGAGDIQFMSYSTESDSVPAAASLNKQYYLPPNTLNAIVMTPNNIYSTDTVTKYRFTLNNKATTNRDIEVKSGLHYDQLNKSFINMGMKLSNLDESFIRANQLQTADASRVQAHIFCTPVPVSQNMTQMGLRINFIR